MKNIMYKLSQIETIKTRYQSWCADKNDFKKGYVMLLTTIIFMMVSIIIIFGISTPTIKQILLSRDIWSAKQSYYLSEAGVEDVMYRLKDSTLSSKLGSVETLSLDGYNTAVTTITNNGSGKIISTLSNQNGYKKSIMATVDQGAGASFFYAMQAGQGGFTMTGSSGIIGNVFSNGPIYGSSSCYITGSAIVANSPNMTADQKNDIPTSSPNSIIFSTSSATQDIAQSFQVSSTSALTQLSLYIKKVGNPTSITVKIVKNSSGSPSSIAGDVVASATIDPALITTSFDWLDVSLSPNPNLVVGTTYWIVLDTTTGSGSNYYVVGANLDNNYLLGTAKIGSLGGTWVNSGYDSYFRVFLGGYFGTISGFSQYNPITVGSSSTDLTWAHNVSYVTSAGPIRCQNDTLNNKACDQSYADPSPVSYPVSSANITAWEGDATAGGSIGSYTRSDNTPVSLGPTKIVGDLHISGSVILTMNGTLYVTGNLIIDGDGRIKLASSYGSNSGVIVVDGTVTLSSNDPVEGTGEDGSYIMIITNSSCAGGSTCSGAYAASISGAAGAMIMNAQKGTLYITGSGHLNQATANMIKMDGNTRITYESGIVDTSFTSGPTGGWNISGWGEQY
jgi:hypothetical protein